MPKRRFNNRTVRSGPASLPSLTGPACNIVMWNGNVCGEPRHETLPWE